MFIKLMRRFLLYCTNIYPCQKKLTWKTRILQFELHVGQSSRQMWDIFSPLWNPLFSAILIVQLWAQKRNSAKVVWISDKTKVHFLLGFRTPGVPPMLVTLAPFQGETCQISSLSLSDSNSEWKKSRRYFFISLAKQDFQGSSLTSLPRNRFSPRLQLTAKFSLPSFKTF